MSESESVLQQAIKGLAIMDVVLRESSIKPTAKFDPLLELAQAEDALIQSKHYMIGHEVAETGSSENKPARVLRARFFAAFRVLPADFPKNKLGDTQATDDASLIEITAEFAAYYRVVDVNLPDEAIDVFCNHNVPYHVWPYWREYAQSVSARARLPNFVPPFLRVATK